jgi:hypothetical protein
MKATARKRPLDRRRGVKAHAVRPLAKERAWFESNRQKLFAKYPRKWAVVSGGKLIGIYGSFSEAFEKGSVAAGTPHILVKQILLADGPMNVPALTFGLLGGRVVHP